MRRLARSRRLLVATHNIMDGLHLEKLLPAYRALHRAEQLGVLCVQEDSVRSRRGLLRRCGASRGAASAAPRLGVVYDGTRLAPLLARASAATAHAGAGVAARAHAPTLPPPPTALMRALRGSCCSPRRRRRRRAARACSCARSRRRPTSPRPSSRAATRTRSRGRRRRRAVARADARAAEAAARRARRARRRAGADARRAPTSPLDTSSPSW